MTTEKALELLNELRLRVEMKGVDHDLAREAYLCLKSFVAESKKAP
jgi:hypothetical protein